MKKTTHWADTHRFEKKLFQSWTTVKWHVLTIFITKMRYLTRITFPFRFEYLFSYNSDTWLSYTFLEILLFANKAFANNWQKFIRRWNSVWEILCAVPTCWSCWCSRRKAKFCLRHMMRYNTLFFFQILDESTKIRMWLHNTVRYLFTFSGIIRSSHASIDTPRWKIEMTNLFLFQIRNK